MMWHGGQDPNWLPYRYSFLVSFVLISMAAEIFSNLEGYKLSLVSTGGSLAGIGILVAWFCDKMKDFNYNESKYKYVAITPYKDYMNHGSDRWEELWLGTIAFGMILAAIYMILVYLYSHFKKQGKKLSLSRNVWLSWCSSRAATTASTPSVRYSRRSATPIRAHIPK